MKYHTVHQAKTNLSQLIKKACEGDEVIIAHGKKPVVKLLPVGNAAKRCVPSGVEEKISSTTDAFDRLTDEEMKELGFETE